MKDKTKNTPQVLLRRAVLVLLDAAIVAFSFYFALLLRADGAVEAVWWPHNRALLYENLPWIVAVYIVLKHTKSWKLRVATPVVQQL